MTMATLIKENIYLELAYSSEVQSIIIMVGHGSILADMVLGKELRASHIDLQATGSELSVTLSEA